MKWSIKLIPFFLQISVNRIMKILPLRSVLMIGQTMSMFPCLMKDTVPVDDVVEFELTGTQLKCASGCDIMPIASIICHRMKEMEQEENEVEVSTSTAHLSGKAFHCVPSPQLSPNLALILHRLDCQYCATPRSSSLYRIAAVLVMTLSGEQWLVCMILLWPWCWWSSWPSCWSCCTRQLLTLCMKSEEQIAFRKRRGYDL